jgi:hypothetical protein
MATSALVSVGEYLSTSYRPDREMLEGQLIEWHGCANTNANGTSGYSRNNASEFQLPVFEFPMCALKRRAYLCTQGDFREPDGEALEVAGTPIRVPSSELFAELD